MITTTAAKVVLAQNNEQTAERFTKMIGTKTIEVKSTSKQEGLSTGLSQQFSQNVSRSFQQSNVISVANIMSLDSSKQYVIFQGHTDHPILADSPRYFLDRTFLKRTQMPCAPFVPAWVVARREKMQENKQPEQNIIEPTEDTGIEAGVVSDEQIALPEEAQLPPNEG